MDSLLCNKCFVPMYKGIKQPYGITQCGHIFCQNCLQLAEKQCPQCNYIAAVHIPLIEPLCSKIAPFFTPISDTLEMLIKVEIFRSNQMKITMQRFYDIEKKYDVLKKQMWIITRNLKALSEKYNKLKAERELINKKILFYEMHRNVSLGTRSNTPTDSNIFKHPSNSGYSSGSYKSANITPMQSTSSIQSLQLGSMNLFSGSDKNSNHPFNS